jgi:hypothetical protein
MFTAGMATMMLVSAAVIGLGQLAAAAESPAAAQAHQPAAVRAESPPAAAPAHRVLACYFHRTVRCPTCKKISAYIEESLKSGLGQQMKEGTVSVQMIDYQDAKNQKYTKYYKIAGPTLVIIEVQDGKVKNWKTAPRVWSLVGNKDAFLKYVQGEVRGYLETK